MAKNFNQDISQIEKVYSGKWIPDILAEYWCSQTQTGENNRHKKAKWMYNEFFVVRIMYIETFRYLTRGILIRNQHIIFIRKAVFF